MSSVFQALLGLTAAKDRRASESSREGRGGGVWLAARLTTPQQGCERPVSEHSLIYQWNATAAAACERVLFSQRVCKRGREGRSWWASRNPPERPPTLNPPRSLAAGLLKGSSTKRKRERHRESKRLDRAAHSETERERERAESKGSGAGSLGGGLRR